MAVFSFSLRRSTSEQQRKTEDQGCESSSDEGDGNLPAEDHYYWRDDGDEKRSCHRGGSGCHQPLGQATSLMTAEQLVSHWGYVQVVNLGERLLMSVERRLVRVIGEMSSRSAINKDKVVDVQLLNSSSE